MNTIGITAMRDSGLEYEIVTITARTSKVLKRKALIWLGIMESVASMSLENLLTTEPDELDSKKASCPLMTLLNNLEWIDLLAPAAETNSRRFLRKAHTDVAMPIAPYTPI